MRHIMLVLAGGLLLATAASSASSANDHTKSKRAIALTAASLAAATVDMSISAHYDIRGNSEDDPLARPIMNLPRPAGFAIGYAGCTVLAYAAYKMRHSTRPSVRKVWWLPQTIQVVANSLSAAYTVR